jgi:hypothetical protein
LRVSSGNGAGESALALRDEAAELGTLLTDMNRIPSIAAVLAALLLVLAVSFVATFAPTRSEGTSQELALATPPHFVDYESVSAELQRHGFGSGVKVDLGTPRLLVSSTDFKRTRDVARGYSRRHSMTLRIARDSTSGVWEVWERGTKQREETYWISPSR